MKYVLLLSFLSMMFWGCRSNAVIFNRLYQNSEGQLELIGRQTVAAFEQESFANWYKKEYDSYTPNPQVIKEIKKKIKGYHIEIFLGTWCSDSKREFPRFMKIVDAVGIKHKKIKIYAVNRKKESFYGEQLGKNILYVPTFIVYGDRSAIKNKNIEKGRIIESPVGETLEEDLLKIISNQPYTPNYYY